MTSSVFAMAIAAAGLADGISDDSTAIEQRSALEIVVTGQRADDVTSTATRTLTPLRDIPQSIQIVERETIEDQDLVRLADVLSNIAGVQPAGSGGNRGETFLIRGFATPRYAIDGVLLNRVADRSETFLDLANVASVEVLKGPASVMYGQGDPGGVINITTLRPSEFFSAAINPQIGSFDFARISATVSGPLTRTGDLAVRVTGAAQTEQGFRGEVPADSARQFGAFAARWRMDGATEVNLDLDYTNQSLPFDRGLPVSDNDRIELPADRFLGETFSRTGAEKTRAVFDIAHAAADWLALRFNARYLTAFVEDDLAIDNRDLREGRLLRRRVTDRTEDLESVDLRGEAVATFATGTVGHTLLAGVNYSGAQLHFENSRANIDAIDIFDPVYGAAPPETSLNSRFVRRSDLYSAYIQDQVALTGWLKLLGSLRHDEVRDNIDDTIANSFIRRDNGATTLRGGMVLQPGKAVALFGGYSESFQPQIAQARDGRFLDPERGRQWEAGLKYDSIGGRLVATLAAFDIRRFNVATADPADTEFSIQTGEQSVRGVELDVTGRITPQWQAIAALSYLDAELAADETFQIGNRLTNVPRWSGRFWTSYRFGPLTAPGPSIAGGITHVGNRAGDLDNSFAVDGYTILDATVRYEFPDSGLEISLTGRNLTNEFYIESAVSRQENYPGSPRSFIASLRAAF